MPQSPVTPGAWAVVNHDTPQIFLAEDAAVISRLIALKIVAASEPGIFGDALPAVRDHLLHQRWPDAVVAWIEATGTTIDVYEEFVRVWTHDRLDHELALMAIRTSRLFEGHDPESG
ncbi:MAG: hypothetical protein AAF567_23110 [Actinomycetota bacterium]